MTSSLSSFGHGMKITFKAMLCILVAPIFLLLSLFVFPVVLADFLWFRSHQFASYRQKAVWEF